MEPNEKIDPTEEISTQKRPFFMAWMAKWIFFVGISLFGTIWLFQTLSVPHTQWTNPDALCPAVPKIDSSKYNNNHKTIEKLLHDQYVRNASVDRLLNAVRIPTEIYDDMIDPSGAKTTKELFEKEPRWKPFAEFHQYLEKTFPLAHKHLKLEKINKFSLVYTWQGSNTDKKPLLLAAHYDVVPVQKETVDKWTFPPFEGGSDGTFLYGRGVSDCKNLLIGLLEAVEQLLGEGQFQPERTVILAFGYDEEALGFGAGAISEHLLLRYGEESILQIIDEGSAGFTEMAGRKFIIPATGEKGHLNSIIELYTPGGHSSVPPKHTAIGLLSRLIARIEDNEFSSIMTNANPVLSQLQCMAEHASIDSSLRKDILKAHLDVDANKRVLEYMSQTPLDKFLVTTSQAVDIVEGGVKSNALPEHASVLVNHRIAVEESVKSTSEKVLREIVDFAQKFDLGVIFENLVIVEPTEHGYFNYSLNEPLEPAPVTPRNDEVWDLFGGSLRHLYEDLVFPDNNETFVFSPYLDTGNTDTKSYWDLSKRIFRYSPGVPTPKGNIHSVDERTIIDGHMQLVAFYYYYLQVVDTLEQ